MMVEGWSSSDDKNSEKGRKIFEFCNSCGKYRDFIIITDDGRVMKCTVCGHQQWRY